MTRIFAALIILYALTFGGYATWRVFLSKARGIPLPLKQALVFSVLALTVAGMILVMMALSYILEVR